MTEVKFLSQSYQYIPMLGVSGYVREELISGTTTVDGEQDREMMYKRTSTCSTSGGDFEPLYELPYGFALTVSGG